MCSREAGRYPTDRQKEWNVRHGAELNLPKQDSWNCCCLLWACFGLVVFAAASIGVVVCGMNKALSDRSSPQLLDSSL